MGNRAVITMSTAPRAKCIYLHWNGGRDSVKAFLHAAKLLQIPRTIEALAQMIADHHFKVELNSRHVYLDTYAYADKNNYDNGVYVIDTDWNITKRRHMHNPEQTSIDWYDMAKTIVDNAQSNPMGLLEAQ